jgi:hypothetical protein
VQHNTLRWQAQAEETLPGPLDAYHPLELNGERAA